MQPKAGQIRKRILIVDDDAWLRPVLAELLTDEGYDVLEAGSGREAVRTIREECPDVVVLDVGLPGRSGISVLDEVKADERTRSLAIILVSGEVDLVQAGQAHRAAAALHKPLDLGVLLSKVAMNVPRAA